jgi:hypothetical protein
MKSLEIYFPFSRAPRSELRGIRTNAPYIVKFYQKTNTPYIKKRREYNLKMMYPYLPSNKNCQIKKLS